MADLANVLTAVLSSAVVQTTAVFAVGLLIARCLVRQPARAHAVLALTFVAAVAVPLASHVVRLGGWGLLMPQGTPTLARPAVTVPPAAGEIIRRSPRPDHRLADGRIEDVPRNDVAKDHPPNNRGRELAAWDAQAQPATPPRNVAIDSVAPSWLPAAATLGFSALVLAWPIATAIAAARLFGGALAGRRLLAAATECREPAVAAALVVARRRLELETARIDVYQLDQLHCPIIWCWSSYPRIILPRAAASRWTAAEWAPILCHELAHWKRRDHYSALIAEIVCCLIPWQPLAWWSRRRLEHASEQACDDWAVAAGHSATEYAEALLGLVAQSDPPLALAVLRRSSGLAARVRHVLTQRVPRPRLGRAWAVAALTVTVAGVAAAALSQRGVAREEPAPAKVADAAAKEPGLTAGQQPPAANGEKSNKSDSASEARPAQPSIKRAFGKIVDPEGKPVAGAQVVWEATYLGLDEPWEKVSRVLLARSTSDAEGAFSCEAALDERNIRNIGLVIRAPEYGIRGFFTAPSKLDKPFTIGLERAYSIEGAVFTPNGEPVKDATIRVNSISRPNRDMTQAEIEATWYLRLLKREPDLNEAPEYWPAPLTTDANGQFRFDRLVPRSATASLVVLTKDYPPAHVAVADVDSVRSKDENWREPKFTLVLETPFVVEGRFLDADTNEPIEGVQIQVNPVNYGSGGTNFDVIRATSGADGRYSLRLGSADTNSVGLYAPLGYPGIHTSLNVREIERRGGPQRKVTYDFKLRRTTILRGRVVDGATDQGVSEAKVTYYPLRNRRFEPNGFFRPAATDKDGNFEVTGADGKGFLLVDAPRKGFYRLAVEDERIEYYHFSIYPHGLLEVDAPATAAETAPRNPYVISLRRGPELVVQGLTPDGTPATDLFAACAGDDMFGSLSGRPCPDGLFRLEAAEPGRVYRVFLYSEATNSGAAAKVLAPADGRPVEVRLQPCGTLRGRYVHEDGTPVSEITEFTRFKCDPDRAFDPDDFRTQNSEFYGNFAHHKDTKRTTDADGRFEIKGIVPGMYLYLSTNYEFVDGKEYYEVGALAPGEVKDVGNIVIRPD